MEPRITREGLIRQTRLLGAEHEGTLASTSNLACALWQCGQKTEAEYPFRSALTLSRHALGPVRKVTQSVLQQLRAIGLEARRAACQSGLMRALLSDSE